MTPRATRSTRVLFTTFMITASRSTPGLHRMWRGELGDLAHAGVAADLAVVGGPAAVAAHGVEGGEAGAAAADDQPQVAGELHHAAGHAAVVHLVDLRRPPLEGASAGGPGGRPGRCPAPPTARRWRATASSSISRWQSRATQRAVGQSGEGVDLRQGQVVRQEELRPGGEARRPATPVRRRRRPAPPRPRGRRTRTAGSSAEKGRRDDVLRLPRRHLLDVDAAAVGDDGQRSLGQSIVGHAQVVLPRDVDPGLHQEALRLPAGHLQPQDRLGRRPRLVLASRRSGRRQPSSDRRIAPAPSAPPAGRWRPPPRRPPPPNGPGGPPAR